MLLAAHLDEEVVQAVPVGCFPISADSMTVFEQVKEIGQADEEFEVVPSPLEKEVVWPVTLNCHIVGLPARPHSNFSHRLFVLHVSLVVVY